MKSYIVCAVNIYSLKLLIILMTMKIIFCKIIDKNHYSTSPSNENQDTKQIKNKIFNISCAVEPKTEMSLDIDLKHDYSKNKLNNKPEMPKYSDGFKLKEKNKTSVSSYHQQPFAYLSSLSNIYENSLRDTNMNGIKRMNLRDIVNNNDSDFGYERMFNFKSGKDTRINGQFSHLERRTFTLGYLTGSNRHSSESQYMRPGLQISGAITLAVNEINEFQPLAFGHRLGFIVAETNGQELESILQTANLWLSNVSAYIGPQETCVHEARMAAAFHLPMLSYFCTHPETSKKDMFPTFARTRPPDNQISKSVASVLKRFNWKKVIFLYNGSPDEDFGPVAKTIQETLRVHNITVVATRMWNSTYFHAFMDNIFDSIFRETYMDCRIYVALGFYYEFLGIMSTMEEQNLFAHGEYFVVGVMLQEYNRFKPEQYLQDFLSEESNVTLQTAFQNFIGVIPTAPVGSEEFHAKVDYYLGLPPFNYPNAVESLGGIKKIRPEAAYLYDAVNLYAKALNKTILSGGDPFNGTRIIANILDTTYRSARGYMVHMDIHGDAEGNYTLLARHPLKSRSSEFGLYPVGDFRYWDDYSGLPELHLTRSIEWKNGYPPVDEPSCGFKGEKCLYQTAEIIAGVAGSLALLLCVFFLLVYRNWKYEQELDSLLWKIDYKDVKINDFSSFQSNLQQLNREKSTRQNLCSAFRSSQVSLSSNFGVDFRFAAVYTQLGIYKGRIVAVKRISCKTIDITRKLKKELKTMRDLRHDHLLGFVGACVDPPNICFLTEYCSRGSLKDILENEDVRLDSMFIASLTADIVQGMIFLHDSPIRFHGSLKTSNCLVDSRWVVKISDFGFNCFKASFNSEDDCEGSKYFYDLLYKAPELLRRCTATGSQKGDVYSFAIVLYEIHGRNGPYGPLELAPSVIISNVKIGPKDGREPFRPPLEKIENCFDCVRCCLKECWAENQDERPEFRTIRHKLRPMRKGMKANIFDNMLEIMEKYANNLEALVDERTDLLIEEKKKTDALLYEMLPRVVAEQLKKGHGVEAESFDCVTIFFSDIVGFTEMSAQSTALQIVDFLNDLYTCFDSIIENYDVYKVETIGDAYMVVSGLPIRNDKNHTKEIASMSLHLLESIKKFQIRHRPTDMLKLRIGIHSGPVCAGVVGVKMPRYCLFGDTVNTASRMESLGLPLKIHCSLTYKEILSCLGGYEFEERGNIKVKGKGDMTTYWLIGKELKAMQREIKKGVSYESSVQSTSGGALGSLRGSLKSIRGQLKFHHVCSEISSDCQKKIKFVQYGSREHSSDDSSLLPQNRYPKSVKSVDHDHCSDEPSFLVQHYPKSRSTSLTSISASFKLAKNKTNNFKYLKSDSHNSKEETRYLDIFHGSDIFPLLKNDLSSNNVHCSTSEAISELHCSKIPKIETSIQQSLFPLHSISPARTPFLSLSSSSFSFNSMQPSKTDDLKPDLMSMSNKDFSQSNSNKEQFQWNSVNLNSSPNGCIASHSESSLSDASESRNVSKFKERCHSIYLEAAPLLKPLIKNEELQNKKSDIETPV